MNDVNNRPTTTVNGKETTENTFPVTETTTIVIDMSDNASDQPPSLDSVSLGDAVTKATVTVILDGKPTPYDYTGGVLKFPEGTKGTTITVEIPAGDKRPVDLKVEACYKPKSECHCCHFICCVGYFISIESMSPYVCCQTTKQCLSSNVLWML